MRLCQPQYLRIEENSMSTLLTCDKDRRVSTIESVILSSPGDNRDKFIRDQPAIET